MTSVRIRVPDLKPFPPVPIWWHCHGTKMRVKMFSKKKLFLRIAGSAASIEITPHKESDCWSVAWEVIHSVDARVNGRTILPTSSLRSAFRLSDLSGEFGEWIIGAHGGTCAEQREFIRWETYLNIPCPGTGHDGDPNVSIWVTNDIRDAVKKLIKR